ncbi:MAG: adenine phosphoribosyltransferase [Candidatus Ratteibacteria bacterium]|jgi:adenine phosphoribosyltransferase
MKPLIDFIRTIPDFPEKGILFQDITPLLKDPEAFQACLSEMAAFIPPEVEKIVGIEARGFIFGAGLATYLKKGFIPMRKKGKLPAEVRQFTYDLEYGTDTIEIHADALAPGEKVALIDDVLATGGTAQAACRLIEDCGGILSKVIFLMELKDLKGKEKLSHYEVVSLLTL